MSCAWRRPRTGGNVAGAAGGGARRRIPPRIRGRGQARSILKKPPAKNFRKMFSEKKHGRICFANIRTIHNLTRPPPPESRKIIRAARGCIFRFSRKRATENICRHAGVCVLCYFPFFAPGPVAVGGGFVFGRRAPPRIPPPVSNPRKKHSRPARFAPGPPAPPICGGGVQMCQESPPFFCPLCQPRKKLSGAACFRARRPHPPGCRKCVALMSQRYFVFSRPPDRGRPAGEPPRHSPARRIEPRRLPPRRSAACFRLRKNFRQGAHSARAGAFAGCCGCR